MATFSFKLKLIPWLVWAYLKNNFVLFAIGITLGLFAVLILPTLIYQLPSLFRVTNIGIVGSFTISTLPLEVQEKVSFGLTSITKYGDATSAAALSFETNNEQKKITFNLKPNLYWQDGKKFTIDDINYNLKGAQIVKRDSALDITLTEPFGPLATVLSQPLFKTGLKQQYAFLPQTLNNLLFRSTLIGLGSYRVENISKNGRFISQIKLKHMKTNETINYKFYPSEEIALSALKLGQINQLIGLSNLKDIKSDPTLLIVPKTEPRAMAILFYNFNDRYLADKAFRQALTYSLPDDFQTGFPTNNPLPKENWALTDNVKKYSQNLEFAKTTLAKLASASASKPFEIHMNVHPGLEEVANIIQTEWAKANIKTTITNSDITGPRYQTYLTTVELPADPDQYFLWHSTQETNISNYKSPKVDRLIEEGRTTFDKKERKIRYSEFQKAITEDAPAAFLYYPTTYTVSRKY